MIAVGPTGTNVSFDGGVTWRSVRNGAFDAVECTGDGACWASGPEGRVGLLDGLKKARDPAQTSRQGDVTRRQHWDCAPTGDPA